MIIAPLKLLVLLLLTVDGEDQSLLLETFDSGTKGAYSDDAVILPTGDWWVTVLSFFGGGIGVYFRFHSCFTLSLHQT